MHILHYFVSLQKKVNTYTAPEIGEKPISANGGLLSLCNPITSLRGKIVFISIRYRNTDGDVRL